jgi:hypothetical protein
MSDNITQLVRESPDRLTAGAAVPAGLAAGARRGARRRAITVRTAAALTAAAATAAAVILAAPGAPRPRTLGPASLTAFVISQARHELTLSAARDVVRATLTGPAASSGISVVSWSGPVTSKTELAGGPSGNRQAGGYVLRHGGATVVTIDYGGRTWAATTIPAGRPASATLPASLFPLQTIFRMQVQPGSPGCAARSGVFTVSWTAFIRQMLRCGAFTVAGSGRIDGVAAIKLISRARPYLTGRAVMWISKASHLPLRLILPGVSRRGPGQGAGAEPDRSAGPTPGPLSTPAAPASGYQVDLLWLPPSRANLARASILPVPAGFTRLPWPS